jgi:methanesulfonate monooxygenase small subunit
LDGGVTQLFAVAKLYDIISVNGAGARFVRRNVRLETRMLGIGSHIPF